MNRKRGERRGIEMIGGKEKNQVEEGEGETRGEGSVEDREEE